MLTSQRAGGQLTRNAIARTHAELLARGIELTDVTDTNPTRHGLFDPAALDIVAEAARRCTQYEPEPRGDLAAREALAARLGGEASEYWLTASTSEAYSWLYALLTDPGDAVAVPVPGYPLLDPLAALAGIATRPYSSFYVHPHGWSSDPDSVALALSGSVRALVTVNPGNPTGAYSSTDLALRAAIDKTGVPIIADEVFLEYHVRDAAPTLADCTDGVVFTLGGLSKLLCAPQLKLGWIRLSGPPAATAELAAGLDRIADTFLSVNAPVAAALADLLRLADSTVARVRNRLRTNADTLGRLLSDEFRVRRLDGGWVALVDAPRHRDDDEMALRLLREAHLSVHPGWYYDCPDPGLFALSLLPEPDRFATYCALFKDAVASLA